MASVTLLGQFTLLATIYLFQTDEAADFQSLGRLLLVGFAVAVGAGIAFTVIKLKLREKRPPNADFISISQLDQSSSNTAGPGGPTFGLLTSD